MVNLPELLDDSLLSAGSNRDFRHVRENPTWYYLLLLLLLSLTATTVAAATDSERLQEVTAAQIQPFPEQLL